jgi:signal transduction histidine kinase
MRQLLQNLIGNALKFFRPGAPPRVRVSAQRESRNDLVGPAHREACRLSIEDNGIGFDEKYLDRIFTPFQRLHSRESYKGTGMGLAICRRIAERHGGAITARSEPGVGSTFIVVLPFRQETEAENETS